MLRRIGPWTAAAAVLFFGLEVHAQGAAAERFEKKIRPLFAAKCWSCHGPDKQKGGLRLDSAAALLKGGDAGAALVVGKPDESLIVEAVRYAGDLKMPPKGKLSDAEIAEVAAWVREGATWPGASPVPAVAKPASTAWAITPEQRDFWAFRKVAAPVPPTIRNPERAASPIDKFILAKLDEKGLKPAPPASKRDLIRRATFDLTGLPPTPEEVDAFLADATPDAFAKVVDRLLGSPAYGERWGRHWLDLARYADSNGMDENVAYANAHHYRDYVVRSFNADKPYDVFLTEQLAGDLLPPAKVDSTDRDRVIATGFLVLGPKMLAEDDPMKMEMDIIDEQVDTVGRVFMGLTLGCARCHDHKFDPVPASDYYGLAGIFKSTKSMQNHKVVAMWNERQLADEPQKAALAAHKKQASEVEGKLKSETARARAELRKEIKAKTFDYVLGALQARTGRKLASRSAMAEAKEKPPAGALVVEAEAFAEGNVLVDKTHYGVGIGVILNKRETPNFAVYRFEILKAGAYRLELRYAAAESRPVRVSIDGKPRFPEAAKTVTGSWFADGQRWEAAGLIAAAKGRTSVRLECDGPFPHFDKLALVPIEAAEGVKTTEEIAAERRLNPRLIERWAEKLDADKTLNPEVFGKPFADSRKPLVQRYVELFQEAEKAPPDLVAKNAQIAAARKFFEDPDGPLAVPKGNRIDKFFAPETSAALKKIQEELDALAKSAPPVTEVMGVEERTPTDLKIHIRGNHTTLGEVAPRRFLRVIAGESQKPLPKDRSGRLELASWLTSPEHPLTARVMVNRIWQGHFGSGLVRSSDNFGLLGERPSHPELLDWLAGRFVASGWSIKATHRLIMLSTTYRMGTALDPAAAQADPDNRLHWRFDRRRLEAEAVRDALLAVSGDLRQGSPGTFLTTKNHAYVNNTGERGRLIYEDIRHRSVYLPIVRSGLYEVLQAFDFADPSASSGLRTPTTVAPQALFMLNDDLMLKSSESLAKRLLDRKDLDDRGRVAEAYRLAFARRPTEAESTRALTYLSRFDAVLSDEKFDPAARPLRSWRTLCQALLASSEFLYLD